MHPLRRPPGSSPSPINLPDMDALLEKHAVPTRELLSFYKKRVSASERDAEDAIQKLVAVESHSAEIHRLRWALRSRDEEVKELQQALSNAKVYLYDEREVCLRLKAENDELKAKEMEDRKKIEHLLALTEPMAQEFTYFRNPSLDAAKTSSAPQPALNTKPSSSARTSNRNSNSLGRSGFGLNELPVNIKGARIVQSVKLPGGAGGPPDELRSVSLKRQLEEVQRLADERSAAMMRDRAAIIDAGEKRTAADASTIQSLEREVEELQAKLTHLTRDYLSQRQSMAVSEREAHEELAVCRAAREAAEAELSNVKESAQAEVKASLASTEAHAKALSGVLKARAEQFEDAVAAVTINSNEAVKRLETTVSGLRDALKKAKEKYATLEQRRAWDLEGFQRDTGEMKRVLKTLELQWLAWSSGAYGVEMGGGMLGQDERALGEQVAMLEEAMSVQQGSRTLPPLSSVRPSTASRPHKGMVSHEKPRKTQLQSRPPAATGETLYTRSARPRASGSSGFRATLSGFDPVQYHAGRYEEASKSPQGAQGEDAARSGEGEEALENDFARAMASASHRSRSNSSKGGALLAAPTFQGSKGEEARRMYISVSPHSLATSTATTIESSNIDLVSPIRQAAVESVAGTSGGGGGGGARRVPINSPNAAPHFDPSLAGATTASTRLTSAISKEAPSYGSASELVPQSSDQAVVSPGTIERRTLALDSELAQIRERITSLNSRVAYLQRPPVRRSSSSRVAAT